jgi:short-subunit dehydrogenase
LYRLPDRRLLLCLRFGAFQGSRWWVTDWGTVGSRAIAEGSVLVLGGRSEIGLEVAQRLAPGRVVILAARRSGDLVEGTTLVRAAGASAVHCVEFDADDTAGHPALLEKITTEHGRIGVAVLAFGVLGDQALAERDPAHALAVVHTDFVAQISVLTVLANLLRAQGSGQIVVFSSVAGVRVRRANYVYGSAKAGLDGFASGLGDALHGSGVHLLLVRSGFVVGRMTEGMSPAPLSSTPDQVADAVVKALYNNRIRVWVPGVIRPVFFAMRMLPQAVWRRMPR